jgi:hypothetical protein
VADDLYDLLHPRDEADLATPGPHDPRFAALIAWAKSQPSRELVASLEDVLAHDDVAQQDLAMAVLRKLGVECDGVGFGEDFHWVVKQPDGNGQEIVPTVTRPDLRGDTGLAGPAA